VLPLFDSQPPPKLTDIVLNALAGGAVVVAANARAARSLALSHAEQQRENGLNMWASPPIFDWDSWLTHLWQEHAFSDPGAPLLLTQLQERILWTQIQQNDAPLLVSAEGLAPLSQNAYQRLSEYELHHERNTAWFETDAEHFRQWAKAFDQLCHDRNLASRSNIESLVIHAMPTGSLTLPKHILLAGFDRFTPAQQSLLQIFRKAGVMVELAAPMPPDAPAPILLTASDDRDELLTCAEWCRHQLENNPAIRIGVIAPDIGSIRAEANRTFRSVLMPKSLDITNDFASMPFEFSLGVPLSTVPVVRAALLLLRWISEPLLEEETSWLLLSGFFQRDSSETLDLAQLDFKRRDSGALSPEVSLDAFVNDHGSSPFSKRAKRMLRSAEENQAVTRSNTHAHWCELTEEFLLIAEWPGFRKPDSVQFQAQQRWRKVLDEISLLDFAERKVTFSAFLHRLESHANEITFTAESHHAPIQLLGALESSGQTFDAIWFLGVDDSQWPQSGRPHPLLPVRLQRRAKMPHCDSAADTDLALTVTRRIAVSASESVFSYARQDKEGELRPSPILTTIFGNGMRRVSATEFRKQIGAPEPPKVSLLAESAIISSQIARWPADHIAGGADVLKDQAACPFRAFGLRRLAAKPLNRTEWGLDAAQRGSLLHAILEAVWSPEAPEPFRMVSLEDLRNVNAAQRLDEVLRYHIENAFQKLVREHAADSWMRAYLESEQERLLVRLRDWMLYEAKRQPFTVDKREERLKDVNVGELKLNLRADRIDELPDGSHLLIDYKTGEVSAAAWKGERPDEPQLPLYATYGNVEYVSGILFAQIRAGKTEFVGRAANAQQTVLADLTATSSLVNQPYDKNMHDAWQQALLQLADEFLHGEASVDPKHGADTCTYCPLPGLCRVAEARVANETDAESDDA
jgi:ATP-dependent helicase/nuclease subunit B